MPSQLSQIAEIPSDEVFALTTDFKADKHPDKVSLGAGVYRDENLQPWVLPSVKEARNVLHGNSDWNHEYLPIHGLDEFLDVARDLILGQDDATESPVVSIQTISGTGANHLGAMFLAQQLKPRHVFISAPTWGNHHLIWDFAAPDVVQKTYPYYHAPTRSLDFEGMMSTLEAEAMEDDVVILHACAHNPTGIDPTREQWKALAELFKRKKLFALFDSAYQGFATGDLDADAWAVRHFRQVLFQSGSASGGPQGMCIAQSFAKNFGLYGERVGALHLVLSPGTPESGARTQLLRLVRGEISNPPAFGARVVHAVLSNTRLLDMWHKDIQTMSGRIKRMRSLLRQAIEKHPAVGDWSNLESEIGMFTFTGLSPAHVLRLKEVHHIYLMKSGRASLSGLNDKNVKYVADAIYEVIKHEGPRQHN